MDKLIPGRDYSKPMETLVPDANREVMDFTMYFCWFGQTPLNFGVVLYRTTPVFHTEILTKSYAAAGHGWRQGWQQSTPTG